MRGKQPRERVHYMLRMEDGTLVDVTREVYLEWHQSRRRERYQKEWNRKHGICSLNEIEGKGKYPGFLDVAEGLEDTASPALVKQYFQKNILHQTIQNLIFPVLVIVKFQSLPFVLQ